MGKEANFEEQRRELVAALQSEGLLRSASVIAAMGKVPRELFIPEALKGFAYHDAPLPTEHGQTISAPHDSFSCRRDRARHGRHNG